MDENIDKPHVRYTGRQQPRKIDLTPGQGRRNSVFGTKQQLGRDYIRARHEGQKSDSTFEQVSRRLERGRNKDDSQGFVMTADIRDLFESNSTAVRLAKADGKSNQEIFEELKHLM